ACVAPLLLGGVISQGVLDGPEEIFHPECARSLSGGVADSARVGVQSRRGVTGKRCRPDATATQSRQRRGQAGETQTLRQRTTVHARNQSATRYALLPRDGGYIRLI